MKIAKNLQKSSPTAMNVLKMIMLTMTYGSRQYHVSPEAFQTDIHTDSRTFQLMLL